MSREAGRRGAVVRLSVLVLTITAAFGAVTAAGLGPADVQGWVADAGPAGPALFVIAGGLLGLALFPGHVIATVAGMLFGAVAGSALALTATLLGAGLCLLAARLFGADALGSLLGPRAMRWREWLETNGFSAVLASRLAPGVPAGPINYLAGLVAIRPRAFLLAVALGALPKTIAYVSLGGALSDPLSARGALAAAVFAVAGIAGVLAARRLIRSRPTPLPT